MESFSRLFQEVPDFGEIAFYAVLVAVLVIGVVFGRLLIRGMVNRRVRGIQAEGLDLGDLSTMGQKGLLTPDELKLVRRRFAERQLEQTRERETGLDPMAMLHAIEADPSRAVSLLPPSSEHAKRSIEGLKKGASRSVEDQLREQLGEAPPPQPWGRVAPPPSPAPAPAAAPPPPPPVAWAPEARGARHEPRPPELPPAPATSKPAAGARTGPAGMDLDSMLAQGLISRREYDLLMARVKKATGQ